MTYKTALITGGAIRIGKDICKKLHENGYNIICHYNKSENEAKDLKSELNQLRENSCEIFCLDLNDFEQVEELITKISNNFNSLDVLVNNASSFFKTDIENHDDSDWDDLINSNLRGPFLLSRHCKKILSKSNGLPLTNTIPLWEEHPPIILPLGQKILLLFKYGSGSE